MARQEWATAVSAAADADRADQADLDAALSLLAAIKDGLVAARL